VLTNSIGFKGTWLLTIFMSLAGLFLVAWEYDRLKPILFYTREDKPRKFSYEFIKIPLFFAVGGAVMSVMWWSIALGNFSDYFRVGIGLTIIGAVFGIVVALHYRFMPVGHLRKTDEIA